MTDDTLREECREWFRNELALEPDEEDLQAIIAFARAQRSKVMHDVQGRLNRIEKYVQSGRYAEALELIINTNRAIAQATALEAELPTRRDP